MTTISRLALVSSVCLLTALPSSYAGEIASDSVLKPFPNHARYTAIGDSITHNGWYAPYIQLYYLTRFPNKDLDVFNCGINGDVLDGGLNRFSWDIAPTHPTVASIMFGMNDVNRDLYADGIKGDADVGRSRRERIDTYEKDLRKMVEQLQKDKVQVIVILPTIYDNTSVCNEPHYPGLNEALGECAKRAQKVADETGSPVVDFYHPMLKVTHENQAADPKFSMIGGDRVHPTVQGQLFMAYLFLKAQHVPADVARVSINGTDGSVGKLVNCKVDEVKVEDHALTFRYLANAIPFPIEEWTKAATTWAPFVDDLDQEIFQVSSLPSGTYQLDIDGQSVGTHTAEEFAKGINLATEGNTPQARQAQNVWNVYKERQGCVTKLRTIACVERSAFAPEPPRRMGLDEIEPRLQAYLKKFEKSRWKKAITGEVEAYRQYKPSEAGIRSNMDVLMEKARTLAQPAPHTVKISLAPTPVSATR